MGQAIVVTAKPGGRPGVVIFECNRSLTGMQNERYPAPPDEARHRPPDVLARQLFDLGARHVTIYSNIVVVEASEEDWATQFEDGTNFEQSVIEEITNLFIYYRPGVTPSLDGTEATALEAGAPA
jgi:hypothetical protein